MHNSQYRFAAKSEASISQALSFWGGGGNSAHHIEHIFLLQNSGEVAITLDRVISPCDCTSAIINGIQQSGTITLRPHESVKIRVTLDPSHLPPGPITRSVYVMAKGMSKPFAVLQMTGTIRAGVSFAPASLDFGAAAVGQDAARVVTVTVDKTDVRAGEHLRLTAPTADLEVVGDAPATPAGLGAAYLMARTFTVRLAPKARLGLMNAQMQLEAVDAQGKARKLGAPMSVFGRVLGTAQANPAVLAFGPVNQREVQTRSVMVEGIPATDLAGVKIVCSHRVLTARIEAAPPMAGAPAGIAQLSVTLSGDAPLGGFQGEVTVVTPKGEQLALPVYALVQEAVKK